MGLRLGVAALTLAGLIAYAVGDATRWGRQGLPDRLELVGLPFGFGGFLALLVGAVLMAAGRSRPTVRAVGVGLVAAGAIAALVGFVCVIVDINAAGS